VTGLFRRMARLGRGQGGAVTVELRTQLSNGETSSSGNGQFRSRRDAARRFLWQFGCGEAGSAIVFSVFFIVILLAVVGYAIDTTRFENKRARLQATLDRAVLAAASLSQTLPCEDVVRDYFEKAGFGDAVSTVTCKQSDMGRTVDVTAELEMTTLLMEGTEKLTAPASGSAVETVSDVEIVLVLDITGSMGSNNKLVNMRIAAQDFVSKVIERDKDKRVSIAIVPFGDQVGLSPWLINAYRNVIGRQVIAPLHSCIDLPDSVWSGTAIQPEQVMPQQSNWVIQFAGHNSDWFFTPALPETVRTTFLSNLRMRCPGARSAAEASSYVSLPSQNIGVMQTRLGGLRTSGATTTIQTGMKWGLALIDPAMRPIYARAIEQGVMPPTLAGRPFDFEREKTLKIIVLMTDGENGPTDQLQEGVFAGPSPIYRGEDGNYAIHHPTWPGPNDFYTPHSDNFINATPPRPPPFPQAPVIPPGTIREDGWRPTPTWPGSGAVTQLDWTEVWQTMSIGWIAWQLYARPLGRNNADTMNLIYHDLTNIMAERSPFIRRNSSGLADARTRATCAQAKARGVIVFSIAFEAPRRGEALLRECATSIAHYYAPEGSDISNAFDSIANQISMLRLTQ
jgi:Flp pilus assembly protein TadG